MSYLKFVPLSVCLIGTLALIGFSSADLRRSPEHPSDRLEGRSVGSSVQSGLAVEQLKPDLRLPASELEKSAITGGGAHELLSQKQNPKFSPDAALGGNVLLRATCTDSHGVYHQSPNPNLPGSVQAIESSRYERCLQEASGPIRSESVRDRTGHIGVGLDIRIK